MRRMATLITCLCLFVAGAPPALAQSQTRPSTTGSSAGAVFDPSRSDEKAIAVADQIMAAMGGDAWGKVRYLKFTWVWQQGEKRTAITHYWDRVAPRSRMVGPSKDGRLVTAVVDHATKKGAAAMEGEPLVGEQEQKYVDIAYGRLINDSYWFFMPFKLKDPGVRLRYEGEIKAGPVTYDKIAITFDQGTGLTSGDRYWIYVNRENHMIERWSYQMEGQGVNTSPIAWQWVDWTEVGGLKIATKRTQSGGESEILLEDLQVFSSLPETVFTTTEPFDAPGALTTSR